MTDHGSPSPHDELGGPVLVIGAGLIGASVAMALARAGIVTHVEDVDTTAARVASSRGGGSDHALSGDPALVVVATPPDTLAAVIAAALSAYPAAFVTDVGSVKAGPLAALVSAGVDLSRYVGGHPMAGSERSGPLASAADLFEGRTWAVVPREDADPRAVAVVERLAAICGAVVVHLTSDEHDLAVARVSHLPHVLAALTAGRLAAAPRDHLALSGQGVRDVTRVAGGDPVLWKQIVTANAAPLAALLAEVRDDIDGLLDSLSTGNADGVETLLRAGLDGTKAIPGKHGGAAQLMVTLSVGIPDEPGALARLFADASEAGANIEDVRIDHDPGRAYGLMEIDVAAEQAGFLVEALRARDWSVHR